MSKFDDIRVPDRFNPCGAKTMNDNKEPKIEAFVNAKSRSIVVITFVFAYGWWRIYKQGDDGDLRNWRVTVGRKFRTEDEGREFLLSSGWSRLNA
jgi:hypothetical protein